MKIWVLVGMLWPLGGLRAQLVINEIMVAPPGGIATNSIHTTCPPVSGATQAAEWIEIFNLGNGGCDTVDLSCHILASNMGNEAGLCTAGIGGENAGAFVFPPGTRIPPYGFIVVGGPNGIIQPDFNLADYRNTQYFCTSRRWFLNNSYGWIGLFSPQGVPIDAVFWADNPNGANNILTDYRFQSPYTIQCNCSGQAITLPSAREIFLAGQMEYASHTGSDFFFQPNGKFYRVPDGGAWNRLGPPPNPGDCNDVCLQQADLASVTPSVHVICPGQSVTFNVQAHIPGEIHYSWRSIPAGFTSNATSITVSPSQNTMYVLEAQRGSCSGSRQRDTVRVVISEGLSSAFSVPASLCIGTQGLVTYLGDAPPGATFVWNFGGGNAVPGTGPGPHNVSWTTPGTKTLTLRVIANGCTSDVETRTVQVVALVPVSLSGSESFACTGQAFTVTANGVVPPGSTFAWNFDGGVAVPGTGPGPHTVTWNTPGNRTVTLNVSVNGCPAPPASLNVPVRPTPEAVFTVTPETLCSGQTAVVQYTGNVVGGATYLWDFGDGQMNLPPNGVGPHTVLWNPPGVRILTLRVVAGGCTSTVATRTLTILGVPSSAFTVAQETLCTGQTTTVARVEPAPLGAQLTWDFDGGVAVPGTGQGPHNVYWNTPGLKTVRHLAVSAGCSSTVFQRSIWVVQTPTAQFNLSSSACTGRPSTLTFTGNAPPGAGFIWNFDGATATPGTGPGPHELVWNSPGTKNVTLTVVAGACSSQTLSYTVNVAPTPSSLFNVSSTSVCLDGQITTNLGSITPGATYVWDFDGGTAVPGVGPGPHTVRWNTPGPKTLSLYAFVGGCTSTVHSMAVTVTPVPSAAFSVSASTLCTGQNTNIVFEGTAPAGSNFLWDFDGGTATPGPSGSHNVVWNVPGNKTVRLSVVFEGCTSNVASQNVVVRPTPTADFTVHPSPACVGQNVTLTYTGTGAQIVWDLGTGSVVASDGPNRIVRWDGAGTQTINVYAVENGCTSAVATRTLVVAPTPVASFTLPAFACTEQATNIAFDGQGTGIFVWNFDGGTAVPGTGAGPHSVTWDTPGDKNLSLTVVAGGCTSAVFERTLNVRLRPTVQLFSSAAFYCTGETVAVQFSGTGPAGTTYTWNFDGGTASPGSGAQNQSVVWNTAGNKTVTLTAVANGCTTVAQIAFSVSLTPTAHFSLSRNALCVNESLTTTFTGVAGGQYFWDFDGGTAFPGTGQGPHTVRWNTGGAKTLRLYVVSGACTSSVFTQNVMVYPIPTADFSTSLTQVCSGSPATLTFTGQAGTGAEFFWDFDGGTAFPGTGQGPHTVHWNEAGTKNVRLRVVENACTSQTVSRLIRVNAFPTAAFDLPAEACAGETLTVSFTGFAPPQTVFQWEAGPGQIVSSNPLRVVFNAPGNYVVSLTLDHAGCTDGPVSHPIVVKPVPTASFVAHPRAVCTGRPVVFSFDGNAGPDAILTWNFAGQTSVASADDIPTFVWESEGPKIVELTVEDRQCTSAAFRDTIWVYERLAQAYPNTVLICLGDTLTLTAQLPGNAPQLELFWMFNDSVISHSPSLNVFPSENTEYVLFSRLNDECEYYDTARVRVNDVRPEAAFVFDKTWTCTGDGATVTFTGFAPEGSEYVWDFGPGGAYEPAGTGRWLAAWLASGKIPVRLYVVFDACTSSVFTDTMEVRQTPFSSFEGPSSVCVSDTVRFAFTGTAGASAQYLWEYENGDSLGWGTVIWREPGVYRVRLRVEENGCVSDVWIRDVAVQPIPVAEIAPPNKTACVGEAFAVAGTIHPFDANATYHWDFAGGERVGGSDATPLIVWPDSGTKIVRLRVERQGCPSNETSATIRVRPVPSSQFYCPGELCVTDSLKVTYTGTSEPNATYEWDFDGGKAIPGFGRGPHLVRWNTPGVKYVRLRVEAYGCGSSVYERTVKVGTPDAEFIAPSFACIDSFVGVRYAGVPTSTGTAFLWDFDGGYGEPGWGPGPHRVRWTNPGTKTVRLQVVQNACSSVVEEKKVVVRTAPEIVLEHWAEEYRAPTTVEFRVRGATGNVVYFWDFGDGEQGPDLPYAEKTYFLPGRYPVTVRVLGEGGCEATDEDTVRIQPAAPAIPSAFTPNGDGLNDVLEIKNLSVYQSVHMTIYGRWGMPVFESRRPDVFWDGNNPKGVPVPEGVYTYKFRAVLPNADPVEVYGTVNLIR